MCIQSLFGSRSTGLLLCASLVLGLTGEADAAGKVTSSNRLPVAETVSVAYDDGMGGVMFADIHFEGTVHVVTRVQLVASADPSYEFEYMVEIQANVSDLHGTDGVSQWVAVGADKTYPPDPIFPPDPVDIFFPPDPIRILVPLEVISLSEGYPPDPVRPMRAELNLLFDPDGMLDTVPGRDPGLPVPLSDASLTLR